MNPDFRKAIFQLPFIFNNNTFIDNFQFFHTCPQHIGGNANNKIFKYPEITYFLDACTLVQIKLYTHRCNFFFKITQCSPEMLECLINEKTTSCQKTQKYILKNTILITKISSSKQRIKKRTFKQT